MIKLINFDRDLIRDELVKFRNERTVAPSRIENEYKGTHNHDRLQRELARNQRLREMYSISRTIPMKLGVHIFNYVLLNAFLKKLRGFEFEISTQDGMLKVKYWKHHSKNKGSLYLNDISAYFKEFQYLPIAELEVMENAR